MPPGAARDAPEQSAPSTANDDLFPEEDDYLYEEELLRNPYSLRMWDRYLQARKGATARRRTIIFERALKALPGSYKVRRQSCLNLALPQSISRMLGKPAYKLLASVSPRYVASRSSAIVARAAPCHMAIQAPTI